MTGEEVVLYFDRNLEVLKNVLACAERSAKIRKTEEKAKTNMLTKQKYSFDSNGKLANCESRTLPNVRFLLLREILQVVLPRRRGIGIFRRFSRIRGRF